MLLRLESCSFRGVPRSSSLTKRFAPGSIRHLCAGPELSIPLQGVAMWHRARGERVRALELFERALELRARRGATHPQLCELDRPVRELRAELGRPPLDRPRPERCSR